MRRPWPKSKPSTSLRTRSRSRALAAHPALPLAHQALQAQAPPAAALAILAGAREKGSLANEEEAPGEQEVAARDEAQVDQRATPAAVMPRSATRSLLRSMPRSLLKSETTRTSMTTLWPRSMLTCSLSQGLKARRSPAATAAVLQAAVTTAVLTPATTKRHRLELRAKVRARTRARTRARAKMTMT